MRVLLIIILSKIWSIWKKKLEILFRLLISWSRVFVWKNRNSSRFCKRKNWSRIMRICIWRNRIRFWFLRIWLSSRVNCRKSSWRWRNRRRLGRLLSRMFRISSSFRIWKFSWIGLEIAWSIKSIYRIRKICSVNPSVLNKYEPKIYLLYKYRFMYIII